MKRILLKHMLTPDYIFDAYDKVTPEFLKDIGISALLIDIDNTLAPYEQADPDEKILAWFDRLKANGIKAALISNNDSVRVERFSKELGIPAYADSKKPSRKAFRLAMRELGTDISNTAGLGDQLLTDTLAAHRLKILSIIVPPIKDKPSLFFKLKRKIEIPYINRYYRIQKKKATKEKDNEQN